MNEQTFRDTFSQFLFNYWGAFHEALEAQSVTQRRLAESLFRDLEAAHRRFAGLYTGAASSAVDDLGRIWQGLEARRYLSPDPAFRRDEVSKALGLFEAIHDSLVREGERFPAARDEILKSAPHGTPRDPLRADAAR
jgi:hypothetical protein